MDKYFVYILKCADSSYYVGITNNLEKRMAEHQEGHDTKAYTYSRRPIALMFAEVFDNSLAAIDLEKQLKGWSRKKKTALIEQNWDKLRELSTCKNDSHFKNQKHSADFNDNN